MHPRGTPRVEAAPAAAGRRRRVRLSLWLLALTVAGFYFGFIVLTVMRGSK